MTLGITDRKALAQNPGGRTIRPNHSALEIVDGLSPNQAPDEILHLSTIILVNAFQKRPGLGIKAFKSAAPDRFVGAIDVESSLKSPLARVSTMCRLSANWQNRSARGPCGKMSFAGLLASAV